MQYLKITSKVSVEQLRAFEGVLIDLDGTVYRGDELIPGVKEAVERLKDMGKKIVYLTNAASITREDCRQRLEQHGIEATTNQVVTASFLVAEYLRRERPEARVFVVGRSGLREELRRGGLEVSENTEGVDVVVVGCDFEFTYDKMAVASEAVRRGALLVATDADATFPVAGGRELPGTGAVLTSIEVAGGRQADVITGKPNATAAEVASTVAGLTPNRCVIVGDRLDSDIALGQHVGGSVLVLTGVTREEDVSQSSFRPDFTFSDLSAFVDFLEG